MSLEFQKFKKLFLILRTVFDIPINIPVLLILTSLTLFLSIHTPEAANIIEDIDHSIEILMSTDHIDNEIIVKFKDEIAEDNSRMKMVSTNAHIESGAVVKKNFDKLKGMQLISLSGNNSMKNALK